MKFICMLLLTMIFVSCNRDNQAGSVGSGAGIQEEEVSRRNPNTGKVEKVERMDAGGGEDLNITTPIYNRPVEEQDKIDN